MCPLVLSLIISLLNFGLCFINAKKKNMHVPARAFVEVQVKSLKDKVVASSGWEIILRAWRKLGQSVGRRGRRERG